MKRNETKRHAEEAASRLGTAAAWGKLITEHPEHSDAIAAFAEGRTSTRTLPAAVAVAAVAISDPVAVATLTEGDTRASVTEAVAARQEDTIAGIQAAATLLTGYAARIRGRELAALATPRSTALLETVARYGYTTPDTDTSDTPTLDTAAGVKAVLTLAPTRDLLTDTTTDPVARARVTAAALLNPHTWSNSGYTITELFAAATVLAELQADPDHDTLEIADAFRRCAAHTWCAGGTVSDVATIAGLERISDVDDDTFTAWLDVWSEHLIGRDTNELLAAVTANGAIERHTGYGNALADATPELDARVAFAFTDNASLYGTGSADTITEWLTDPRNNWNVDETLELLASRPTIAEAVHERLAADTNTNLNPAIADTNMAATGLRAWVDADTGVAARLTAAADTAGFGPIEWSLIHRHLETFKGTPEELVAMLEEVCI